MELHFCCLVFLSGSVPKSNGHVLQDTISGLMGLSSPSHIQDNIRKLPHQHDGGLEKAGPGPGPGPYLNGGGSPAVQRKPRYAKKNEVVRPGKTLIEPE